MPLRFSPVAAVFCAALAWAESPEAIAEQGLALLQNGQLPQAEACFSRALQANPRLYEVHNLLGVALDQEGKHPQAATSFRRAIALKPGYAPAHLNLALNAAQTRDYSTAAAEFQRALELDPKQEHAAQLQFDLALALYRSGQYESSLRTLQRLRDPASQDAAYYDLSGSNQRELGHLPAALSDLAKAVELAPESDDYLYDFAIALIQAGQTERALEKLDARLARCRNCASLYAARGVACYAAGRNEESAANYQTALRLDPSAPDLHAALGDLYTAAGAFPPAAREYALAVQLDPANSEYRVKQARNWIQSQNSAQAEAAFRQVLKTDPDNYDALFYTGKLAAERGDLESAIRNLKRAAQKQPGNSAALYQLAVAYRKAGRSAEAAQIMQRFRTIKSSEESQK